MNRIDRRNWLRNVALTGSFVALGGYQSFADGWTVRTLEESGPLLLNANENPFSPAKSVKESIISNFDLTPRYPFRILKSLVEMIAEEEGVGSDQIVITGGSTEGLKAVGLTMGIAGKEIIAADPTFQALLRYAEHFGSKVHRVAVNAKMEHDLAAMSAKVNANTGMIFLCNPNNPTGTLLDAEELRSFVLKHEQDALIFSDEAYYDFITEADYPSMVELVKQGKNVVVSRTFSKVYGLAGLRIGYLIASPERASALKKAVMANTNVMAIEAAKTAMSDNEFYKFSLARNTEAKSYLYGLFDEMGLEYIPSHTNFVFFKTGRPIDQVQAAMKAKNVLVGRPFPPLLDWCRISTGTMEEMKIFGEALRAVMA